MKFEDLIRIHKTRSLRSHRRNCLAKNENGTFNSEISDLRQEVINRLMAHIKDKIPKEEASLMGNFIEQYFLSVSPEDLSSRPIDDLYSAVLSHWHFMAHREEGEAKVRVYNPQLEQHGWQSTHTIIEIVFDDMPFLVDSIAIELNRLEVNIHLIIHMGNIQVRRDSEGKLLEILESKEKTGEALTEAAIYVEIDRQSDLNILDMIAKNIRKVLYDVQTAVNDWPKMRARALEALKEVKQHHPRIAEELFNESIEFIEWLVENHFTFLGVEEYFVQGTDENSERVRHESGNLGLAKLSHDTPERRLIKDFPPEAIKLIYSNEILILGKTTQRSTVHRPVYMDFIVIKHWDKDGNLRFATRFFGLYTSIAYNSSPRQIPYLRYKVSEVLKRSGYSSGGHDDRALLHILETIPRDDLFQASIDELLILSMGILHLQERQRVRLFVRRDKFDNYFSCLVFVPRDAYNSQLREKFQEILLHGLHGKEMFFSIRLSESSLARIHFVIRVNPKEKIEFDSKEIEQKLVDAGRGWKDELRSVLIEQFGEEKGNDLLKRFGSAFPAGYQETYSPRLAVVDIEYIERLSNDFPLTMSLYRPLEESEDSIRFKLYRINATIPLSDVVPILEKMGLRIISERPYEIRPKTGPSIWINDYRMVHPKGQSLDLEAVRFIFQEVFENVWYDLAENDGFNRLVLAAHLTMREITLLRAYAKYLWQVGFSITQKSIEDALFSNAHITKALISLFHCRFDVNSHENEEAILARQKKILESLDSVSSLMEDRILRRYLQVIMATLRTNYFQSTASGASKPYLSFKLDSAKIPELPLPIPLYEIFVYSPRVEAIHLRGAKVARGGIRWSDRHEDFRTEILGLMKAQQIKNAVIVPLGAKGGFVVKQLPENGTREKIYDEVVYCYQTLIRGLLDITDNLKGNTVIKPLNVICYDEDDPYLVVAADKGTATFSDLANDISKEYDFWLKDAFASGGSTGYDHKKMGITARGAWESVKRHFRELAIDIQTTDFTVVGIGDMSGDVFGNGMLLSKHIQLVAAFNHQHIFLDPNPDPKKSFIERQRLFDLPRSSWADYNQELISEGGGVYSRSAKSITLTPEVKQLLQVNHDSLVPNELIRAILKAPVDLLWNGGIGTYVKASYETNAEVGDRTNDSLRVNGRSLRCRVVGEGGNLGLTQLGRIEYAKLGGHLNTDAIDNSGGVNCSDNEVNIKILLNDVVEHGDLTEKQRNELLVEMQDEVAELVLFNNRRQTEAISVAVAPGEESLELFTRVMDEMEREGNLDRALEFLPDKEEIAERKAQHMGLTRPEIAVLMAYSKNLLKKSLIASRLPEDPYIAKDLALAFPQPIQNRFASYLEHHRLKREIIVTRVSNAVINEMGISFVYRLQDETGSQAPDIIRAYMVSRAVFEATSLHTAITSLTGRIDSEVQLKMLQEVNRLIRRGTRWFLRNRRSNLHITETIEHFTNPVAIVSNILPSFLTDSSDELDNLVNRLIESNVPEPLAYRIGGMSSMFSALDIVEAATTHKFSIEQVAALYYTIGNRLHLGWFRELIKKQPVSNHWEALARAAFRDDLDRQQRKLIVGIMQMNLQINGQLRKDYLTSESQSALNPVSDKQYSEYLQNNHATDEIYQNGGNNQKEIEVLVNLWIKRHQVLVDRWEYFITELKAAPAVDFTMFAVALRELLDMTQMKNN